MKNKYVSLTTFCFLCMFTLIGFLVLKAQSSGQLDLDIMSLKQTYRLGEPVELKFVLSNNSVRDVSFDCFWISTGEITVNIADELQDFKEYDGLWGNVDATCNNTIRPKGTLETSARILWNRKIEDSNLISLDVTERARRGKIATHYAFSKAGTYSIKAVAFYGAQAKIESKPISITISEPIGEDLEVWNKIKDRGDIAYFIQEGDFRIPPYKTDERNKLRSEIDQIIDHYPNSFYSESLRQGLLKFRESEQKRADALRKMQKSQ